jgi:two-component system OmpR family sensor kinase
VTLSTANTGAEALIAVADQGPGLEPAAADRVFDRFWRAEPSRHRHRSGIRLSGTGLGLSIAHSITAAHGGTISLDTAPGAGCTFTVRLPVVPAD